MSWVDSNLWGFLPLSCLNFHPFHLKFFQHQAVSHNEPGPGSAHVAASRKRATYPCLCTFSIGGQSGGIPYRGATLPSWHVLTALILHGEASEALSDEYGDRIPTERDGCAREKPQDSTSLRVTEYARKRLLGIILPSPRCTSARSAHRKRRRGF